MVKSTEHLDVQGRKIAVSNLTKILYPGNKFTKGQVIDYYIRISPYILPHLKNRPITLKRYPDGVKGKFFYEKDAPRYTPDWVKTVPVPRRAGGAPIRYILINDLPSLVWLANLASLEIHPFLHRSNNLQRPTSVAFDLDPGEGADVLTCARVALLIRDLLSGMGLESLVKVSGSKGLQLYVPLNTATDYGKTQLFAKGLAERLEKEHPDLVVSQMAKQLRPRKVFIDWSQNSDFKTTVGVYSLRAKADRPYVSAPVAWDELNRALNRKDAAKLFFEPEAAVRRAEKLGDLFASVLELKQRLPRSITPELMRKGTGR
jgi:bifunctional non-homologous end joining protein LigD